VIVMGRGGMSRKQFAQVSSGEFFVIHNHRGEGSLRDVLHIWHYWWRVAECRPKIQIKPFPSNFFYGRISKL